MSTKIKYRLHQQLKDGTTWTSCEAYEREYRHAVQDVLVGFIPGEPRAAIEEGTGRVVYALDATGQPTAAAVKLFSTIELAGGTRQAVAPTSAVAEQKVSRKARPR